MTFKVGSPHGVVANVPDCNIVLSEFELNLGDYIHFQTDAIGKNMTPIPQLWF